MQNKITNSHHSQTSLISELVSKLSYSKKNTKKQLDITTMTYAHLGDEKLTSIQRQKNCIRINRKGNNDSFFDLRYIYAPNTMNRKRGETSSIYSSYWFIDCLGIACY